MQSSDQTEGSDPNSLPNKSGTGLGRRKRVQSACQRCKRQKLKCDDNRPCALCERSGFECISFPRDNRSARSENTVVEDGLSQGHASSCGTQKRKRPAMDQDAWPCSRQSPMNVNQNEVTVVSESQVSEHRLTSNSLQRHTQGNSAMGLTREIFHKFDSVELEDDTYALPGGTPTTQSSKCITQSEPVFSFLELVAMDLPSRDVTDSLLETYINSVHWFMMVFHEPSFRLDYEMIMASRKAPRRKTSFVILLMMVLAMGARYTTADDADRQYPGLDLGALQKSLLAKTTEKIFEIYDMGRLEGVQISILLGSYHLYHARPNLAFAMLGAGIKSAQGMGLHRESSWKGCNEIEQETRKRTWWALYVFDRFASIIFGRPCSINDQDCDVDMVQTLDDTATSYSSLISMESLDGLCPEPVTLMSYQKYKFRLYRIASDVIKDVYFNTEAKSLRVNSVRIVHGQLLDWFKHLPPELRLDSSLSNMAPDVLKLFRLQALALQLAYDNIQILLHRPLLPMSLRQIDVEPAADAAIRPLSDNQELRDEPTDAAQCWNSALRTSSVAKHIDILRSAKNTHAAAYIGMQMFTAGILLSVIALSGSGSSETQESKRAIGRIIRLSKALGQHAILSAQSGKVLAALLRLIMEKEMQELLRDGESDQDLEQLEREPAAPVHPASLAEGLTIVETIPPNVYPPNEKMLNATMPVGEVQNIRLGTSTFDEGLWSVQQVIRHSHENVSMNHEDILALSTTDEHQPSRCTTRGFQTSDSSVNSGGLNPFFDNNYQLNDGQTWLWDANLSFDLL